MCVVINKYFIFKFFYFIFFFATISGRQRQPFIHKKKKVPKKTELHTSNPP
jgi:hypothetical protein